MTHVPSRRSPDGGRQAAPAGGGPAGASGGERRDPGTAACPRVLTADRGTAPQERGGAVERYPDGRACDSALTGLYAACGESVDALHTDAPDAGTPRAGAPRAGARSLERALRRDAALVARGVAVRSVHPQSALQEPEYARHLRDLAAVGVRVRLVERAPLGLLVFDRHTAFLPGDPARGGEPPARITGRLVTSLTAAYEDCWDRGVRFGTFREDLGRLVPESRERAILRLALQGRSDDQIARSLGIHRRTVERRMSEVMERLGVTTRFELGFHLGRRCAHGDAG
ncbi:helix-turn-helix transcriptional regulator [Streptomyces sp. HPF1205]|uniref:helix-turn-helix transcriptional regulator n=1 Tax=Streptomyces sp. HPF1205 TaxID=2873262 RepID=UPI001CEC7937|nr:helix-turn-helix transcriptional regulator [Streptomyces sp. HPF1205]